jgi:ATP-dependent RNA helicase RhlE
MKFTELGLSDALLKAIEAQGYTSPTPIQAKAIPIVLEGSDLLAAAQTGTGKTAGFTLPLLEKLSHSPKPRKKYHIRALVLTPTRELAAQVAESFSAYGKYLNISHRVIFGGVGIYPQMADLKRGVDVVIATPGRLLDIMQQKGISFDDLEYLVLDEADRMLDMGFIHDIKKLLKQMPKKRQTLLFSATFSPEIKALASSFLENPKSVEVSRQNSTSTQIEQVVHYVDKGRKRALLVELIRRKKWEQLLVFTRTKHGANRLCKQLEEYGIKALAIHGNKSQGARTKALLAFKEREIQVLVATDIAARGIDIEALPCVVNYELPNVPEDYVHRIGRTGRASMSGEATSLVCVDEHELLFNIEKFIQKKIPKVAVEGFEPDPTIEAEPIQRGRAKKPSSSSQRKRKPQPKKEEGKTPSKRPSRRTKTAESIGSNLQAKLDAYDKKAKKRR